MKKRKHLAYSKFKKEILKYPEIKAAYESLDPEYAAIRAVLKQQTARSGNLALNGLT